VTGADRETSEDLIHCDIHKNTTNELFEQVHQITYNHGSEMILQLVAHHWQCHYSSLYLLVCIILCWKTKDYIN